MSDILEKTDILYIKLCLQDQVRARYIMNVIVMLVFDLHVTGTDVMDCPTVLIGGLSGSMSWEEKTESSRGNWAR